jgi:hypothetical protein
MATKYERGFFLRLEPDVMNRIEAQCSRFGMTASAYIRMCIIEKLEGGELKIESHPESKIESHPKARANNFAPKKRRAK